MHQQLLSVGSVSRADFQPHPCKPKVAKRMVCYCMIRQDNASGGIWLCLQEGENVLMK